MMKSSPALSLIIPAYNEEQRIAPTLARITDYLEARRATYEIIVVDDGSKDRTTDIVREVAATNSRVQLLALAQNSGKGAAVRAGVLASRGVSVLFSDADLSTPIEELERLEARLYDGADVAVGSRATAGDVDREQRLFRRIQGRAFHLVVRALGLRVAGRIKDTQCGFKLFRGPIARVLFREVKLAGFAFDVELLELACERFNVVEVPVAWQHADGSKVRPGIDAMKMLADVIRIRWSWLRHGRPVLALAPAEPQ
jgi:dolichyl-phosphate beta-glucosyltransferase